jgi:HSP20 family protein
VSLKDYEGFLPRYTEYNVGHYLRRFTLADAARFDAEKVTARIANGTLELRLPKAEKAKPHRITVTAG